MIMTVFRASLPISDTMRSGSSGLRRRPGRQTSLCPAPSRNSIPKRTLRRIHLHPSCPVLSPICPSATSDISIWSRHTPLSPCPHSAWKTHTPPLGRKGSLRGVKDQQELAQFFPGYVPVESVRTFAESVVPEVGAGVALHLPYISKRLGVALSAEMHALGRV